MVDLIVVTGRSSASLTLCASTSRGEKTDRQRPKIGNGDSMVVAVMTGGVLMFKDEAFDPVYQGRSRRRIASL